jgi:ATP-dependent DNA ligase
MDCICTPASSTVKQSPVTTTVCRASIGRRSHDGAVFLYAFDLIELNGNDLRREPLEVRKATLASVLTKAKPGRAYRGRADRIRPCLQDGP